MATSVSRQARKNADAPRPRLGDWLSTHHPFVWRTRALFVVTLGVLATAGAGAYALRMDVRRETLPTVTETLSFLGIWAFVSYSAVLLVVFDVVRRARPIVPRGHLARLAACVGASALALLAPEYVFISLYVPRVASLESDAGVRQLIAFHGPHAFWTCMTLEQTQAAAGDLPRVVADLKRYGLVSQGQFDVDWRCTGDARYDLVVQTDEPTAVFSQPRLFQDRVANVLEAKQYAGHGGAYEGIAMGHVVNVAWPAALAALFAAIFSSAVARRMWTSFVSLTKRRRHGRKRRARVDAWVATRLPALWSSSLHTSMPQLLAVPVLLILIGSPIDLPASRTGWVIAPAIVVAVFIGCRTQEVSRYRSSSSRVDVAVLLTHFAVFCVAVILGYWLASLDRTRDPRDTFMGILCAVSVWCALLQAARNTSTPTAFGGLALIGAAGGVCAVGLAVANFFDHSETLILTWAASVMLFLITLVLIGQRVEARPSLQRVPVAALVAFSPIPGIMAALTTFMPKSTDITAVTVTASLLLALGGTALCLVLTGTTRRRLASSVR